MLRDLTQNLSRQGDKMYLGKYDAMPTKRASKCIAVEPALLAMDSNNEVVWITIDPPLELYFTSTQPNLYDRVLVENISGRHKSIMNHQGLPILVQVFVPKDGKGDLNLSISDLEDMGYAYLYHP